MWWMLWVYGVCESNKIYCQCSFWTKSEGEYTEKHQQEKNTVVSFAVSKKKICPRRLVKERSLPSSVEGASSSSQRMYQTGKNDEEKVLVKLTSRDPLWLDLLRPLTWYIFITASCSGIGHRRYLLAKRNKSRCVEDPALTYWASN